MDGGNGKDGGSLVELGELSTYTQLALFLGAGESSEGGPLTPWELRGRWSSYNSIIYKAF